MMLWNYDIKLNSYGFGEAAVKQNDSCNLTFLIIHALQLSNQALKNHHFTLNFALGFLQEKMRRVYKNILSPFVMHWIFSIDLLFNQNFTWSSVSIFFLYNFLTF